MSATDALAAAAVTHGCTMVNGATGVEGPSPLTTSPWAVPLASFQHAMAVQPLWNRLVDAVARDGEFLQTILTGSDPDFTERLLGIHRRVYLDCAYGTPQEAVLGVFRADYLIGDGAWRNVEVNTISVAFPALATRAAKAFADVSATTHKLQVIDNTAETDVVDGLAAAHELWSVAHGAGADAAAAPSRAVVCFVVQVGERNTGDQRLLSAGLEARGITVIRRSLVELVGGETAGPMPGAFSWDGFRLDNGAAMAQLTEEEAARRSQTSGIPTSDGAWAPVSLFYFRSCYDVTPDFPNDACWAAREAVEASNAIKCPSLPHHLCTWKRIQRVLTDDAVRRRFVTERESATLGACMVGLYLLLRPGDDDATANDAVHATAARVMADAVANPAAYVLKTQKEGTGKIYEGDGMTALLKAHATADDAASRAFRREHLLMERIHSQHRTADLLRWGTLHTGIELEGEVGVYGVLLSTGKGVATRNNAAGYLIRSKPAGDSGGGVMSGVAVLDSLAVLSE